MMMGETTWKPGFETVQEALQAGREFYADTLGAWGRFQRDFHIVSNEHGRFHFARGPAPRQPLPDLPKPEERQT